MRYLLLFLALLGINGLAAQQSKLEVGFTSAFNLLPSLNYAIDYYNDTRPWLDNNLGRHNLLNGYHLAITWQDDDGKFIIRPFALNRRWQRSTARGTTPGGEDFVRKVRTRFTTINLVDYTYFPLRTGFGRIGVGASPFDLSFLSVKTKLNDEKWTDNKPSTFKIFDFIPEIYGGTTFHVDVLLGGKSKGPAIMGQLYYHYNWIGEEQLIWINEALNPDQASNFPVRQTERLRHAGIKIIVAL